MAGMSGPVFPSSEFAAALLQRFAPTATDVMLSFSGERRRLSSGNMDVDARILLRNNATVDDAQGIVQSILTTSPQTMNTWFDSVPGSITVENAPMPSAARIMVDATAPLPPTLLPSLPPRSLPMPSSPMPPSHSGPTPLAPAYVPLVDENAPINPSGAPPSSPPFEARRPPTLPLATSADQLASDADASATESSDDELSLGSPTHLVGLIVLLSLLFVCLGVVICVFVHPSALETLQKKRDAVRAIVASRVSIVHEDVQGVVPPRAAEFDDLANVAIEEESVHKAEDDDANPGAETTGL